MTREIGAAHSTRAIFFLYATTFIALNIISLSTFF
jgi:hypothetical protein